MLQKYFSKAGIIGLIIFLFLGLGTRFYHLDEPNQIVFDEHHFFGFITDYESGNYYFDIHPPLGKLALWANGQLFGLPEFIDHLENEKRKKEELEQEQKRTKEEVNRLRVQEPNNTKEIQNLTDHYNGLKDEIRAIQKTERSDFSIGSEYGEYLNVWGLRALPALFGALLVPLMFLFVMVITRNIWASSVVAIMTLLSPAFLVESQYVLMDSMLMFFVVLGGFFGILYWKNPSWKWWIGASMASAISVSIKWTGLSVVGFSGLVLMCSTGLLIWNTRSNWLKYMSSFFLKALFFWVMVIGVYTLSFAAHFSLLDSSGKGDGFHTAEFLKTIENSSAYETDIEPKTFWTNPTGTLIIPTQKDPSQYTQDAEWYDRTDWNSSVWYGKFAELNIQMGARNASIVDDHPFMSTVPDWIKGDGAIYLWTQSSENTDESNIKSLWTKIASVFLDKPLVTPEGNTTYIQQLHLFSNSYVWGLLFLSTLFGLVLSIFLFFVRYYGFNSSSDDQLLSEQKNMSLISWEAGLVFIMILANILPFVGIDRPKFLYHAFEAVLFAMVFFGIIIAQLEYWSTGKKILRIGSIIFSIFLGIYFFWHSPLIYGFSFPDSWGQSLFVWW